MKISAVKKICREAKKTVIAHREGNAWLGNGAAMYLVDEGLAVNAQNALTILDIQEEEKDKYAVQETKTDSRVYEDIIIKEDRPLYPGMSVDYLGDMLTEFHEKTQDKYYWVRQDFIAPLDTDKNTVLQFAIRDCEDGPLFAIMKGALCVGLATFMRPCEAERIESWMRGIMNRRYGIAEREPERRDEPEQTEI